MQACTGGGDGQLEVASRFGGEGGIGAQLTQEISINIGKSLAPLLSINEGDRLGAFSRFPINNGK
jgi:hypothetical protein